MEKYINYEKATSTTFCSVQGCTNLADYEVALYDEYSDGTVFYEQDFTCPFICQTHKDENEIKAIGARVPRSTVEYAFTNKQGASGYTKYISLGKSK